MKKCLSIFVTILMAMSLFCMGASAETGLNAHEEALVNDLSQAVVNAGGYEVSIPTSYVNQAKNYFISSVDMTEAQYNEIVALLNQGIALVKAESDTNIANYSYAVKAELLDIGKKMVGVLGMTLVYDGQHVVIADAEGRVAFSDEPVLKTTGGADASYTLAIAVGAVLMLMTVAGVVYTKKVTAK